MDLRDGTFLAVLSGVRKTRHVLPHAGDWSSETTTPNSAETAFQ